MLDGKLAARRNGEIKYLNCDGQYQCVFSGENAMYALKYEYAGINPEYDFVELTVDENDVHVKNITSPAD